MKFEHWLIMYDIKDIRRLRKVSRIAEKYGKRVQNSVFEAFVDSSIIKLLRSRINKVIDKSEDSVVYLVMCETDWNRRNKFGKGKSEEIDEANMLIL